VGISVQVKYDALPTLSSMLPKTVQEVIITGAHRLADTTKALAPYDTGELRSSVEVDETNAEVLVRVTAPYAIYVYFGTTKMAARPFLQWAIDQELPRFLYEMQTALAELPKRAGAQ